MRLNEALPFFMYETQNNCVAWSEFGAYVIYVKIAVRRHLQQ